MDFAYLREHMPVLNSIQQIVLTEEDFIQCGLVFYSAQDPAYNLAEVRELRFTL